MLIPRRFLYSKTQRNKRITKSWSWSIQQVISILSPMVELQDEYNPDQGAMKISVDSGIGQYDYILLHKQSSIWIRRYQLIV